jgi:hypothetical protein
MNTYKMEDLGPIQKYLVIRVMRDKKKWRINVGANAQC